MGGIAMFARRIRSLLPGLVLLFLVAVVSSADVQIPKRMNYQGLLTDALGNPITGTRTLIFSIYAVPTGGSALWTETHANVSILNGIFNVVLGNSASGPVQIDLPFRKAYWLGMQVQGDPSEMTPRHLLSNAAYAMASRQVVYQQVITVAEDGGDTNTVWAALQMVNAQPIQPTLSTPYLIEVQAGTYNEINPILLPAYVTVRGQGWNATTLNLSQPLLMNAAGQALESLRITAAGLNPVLQMAGSQFNYVREVHFETMGCPVVVDLSNSLSCDFVDNQFIMSTGPGTGILVGQMNQGRIENCVFDLVNLGQNGSCGITDNGLPMLEGYLLENTFRYTTLASPTGTFGIGLSNGGQGRVSYNVFFGGGGAGKDIVDLVTRVLPVNPFTPDGIVNQDSLGALMPAF